MTDTKDLSPNIPAAAESEPAPAEPEDEWVRVVREINGATVTYSQRKSDIRHDHRARGNALGAAFGRLGIPDDSLSRRHFARP